MIKVDRRNFLGEDSFLYVEFPSHVSDISWAEAHRNIAQQTYLMGNQDSCRDRLFFNLSNCIWASPFTLMSMIVLCHQLFNKNHSIELHFGELRSIKTEDNVLLEHLVHHGFLKQLTVETLEGERKDIVEVYFIEDRGNAIESISEAIKRLSGLIIKNKGYYKTIVPAKVYAMKPNLSSELENSQSSRKNISYIWTENVVNTCKEELSSSLQVKDDNYLDPLLGKIRVICFELFENCLQHAFTDEEYKYISIYCSLRRNSTKVESSNLVDQCATLSQLNFDPKSDQVELHIYDPGKGLLADTELWFKEISTQDKQELKYINELLHSEYKLEKVSNYLFSRPLSKYGSSTNRAKINLPSLTGLQRLGNILSSSNELGEFVRIGTDNSFIGSHFPWPGFSDTTRTKNKHVQYFVKHKRLPKGSKKFIGTYFHFAINAKRELSYDSHRWRSFKENTRVVDLLQKAVFTRSTEVYEESDVQVVDNRDLHPHVRPSNHSVNIGHRRIIWRPNPKMQKNDSYAWLVSIIKSCSDNNIDSATVYIVDIPSFFAHDLSFWIDSIFIRKDVNINLILITRDWHLNCFSKIDKNSSTKKLYINNKYIDSLFKSRPDRLAYIYNILRKLDSDSFWQETLGDKDLPVPVFLQERIGWSDSSGNEFYMKGYLDFPDALSNSFLWKVMRRSLYRTLTIFANHSFQPIDDLVPGLMEKLRPATKNNYFDERIYVGSVLVSGSFHDMLPEVQSHMRIHMLIHPDCVKSDLSRDGHVLNWFNSVKHQIDKEKDLKYERIPWTPFIGIGGEKALPAIRYVQVGQDKENRPLPYYLESPPEMYRYFQENNLIKLGHWVYRKKHELITINLRRAIFLSLNGNGMLVDNLLENITSNMYDKEDASEGKIGSCLLLVYIAHPVTEYLMNCLKQRGLNEKWFRNGAVIPIKRLMPNTVSPLKLSPHVIDRIRQRLVKRFQEASKRNFISKKGVLLLDDGIVTGKTLTEIKYILRGCGADFIKSLAIIDRAGQPSLHKHMKDYLENNTRQWRWDVPLMGHERSCPLCYSINSLRLLESNLSSSKLRKRIQEVIEQWRAVDISNSWGTHGLDPVNIPEHNIKFGYCYRTDNDEEHDTSINATTSTVEAAISCELTSTTTRADKALSWAMKNGRLAQSSIELLCSQLFLYYDELKPAQKIARYKKLIDLLWSEKVESKATAVAALALCLPDKYIEANSETNIAKFIWEMAISTVNKYGFSNIDTILATLLIISGLPEDPVLPKDEKIFRVGGETKSQGAITLKKAGWDFYRAITQKSTNEIQALRNVLNILGITDSPSHSTYLRRILESTTITWEQEKDKFLLSLESLVINLAHIPSDILLFNNIPSKDSLKDWVELINSYASKFKDVLDVDKNNKKDISRWLKEMRKHVYGNGINECLWSNICGVLIYDYSNLDQRDFMAKNIFNVTTDYWKGYVEYKSTRMNTEYWIKNNDGKIRYPEFGYIINTTPVNCRFYFDSRIQKLLIELANNTIHCDQKILFPKSNNRAGLYESKRHLWCEIIPGQDDYIAIVFYTEYHDTAMPKLKDTFEQVHLENIGGKTEQKIVQTEHGRMLATVIKTPSISRLLRI